MPSQENTAQPDKRLYEFKNREGKVEFKMEFSAVRDEQNVLTAIETVITDSSVKKEGCTRTKTIAPIKTGSKIEVESGACEQSLGQSPGDDSENEHSLNPGENEFSADGSLRLDIPTKAPKIVHVFQDISFGPSASRHYLNGPCIDAFEFEPAAAQEIDQDLGGATEQEINQQKGNPSEDIPTATISPETDTDTDTDSKN